MRRFITMPLTRATMHVPELVPRVSRFTHKRFFKNVPGEPKELFPKSLSHGERKKVTITILVMMATCSLFILAPKFTNKEFEEGPVARLQEEQES